MTAAADATQWIDLRLSVNGAARSVRVPANATLLEVLREHRALTGTKEGCGEGECGACSVILDGRLVDSCLVLAVQCEGASVRTVEGLATGQKLHPVQQAFVDCGSVQCGFCIPGMIMASVHILETEPDAPPERVKRLLAGNLCRCTGYMKIFEAVEQARKVMAAR